MKKYILTIACLFLLFSYSWAKAQGNYDMSDFSDKGGYDIYFYNGYGNSSVIKKLKILGIKQIGDKTFVAVRAYDFKLNDTQGYIALDSITAILPNMEIRVETNQETQIRF